MYQNLSIGSKSSNRKGKKNNQIAFNFLLDKFWNDVYGFLIKRTENENDAEDITIQTFSRAFDKINSYNPSYNFKTWLITISKNLHIDFLRKNKNNISEDKRRDSEHRVSQIIDESPSPEDVIITKQNLAELLLNIKKLKPHYQQVIHLRFFQELSYQEISNELNEPMNNVKVKLLRAKKLLSEIIQNKK